MVPQAVGNDRTVGIGAAVVAMLVAAVLLVVRGSGESGKPNQDTAPATTGPSTTPLSSSKPPEPPPPRHHRRRVRRPRRSPATRGCRSTESGWQRPAQRHHTADQAPQISVRPTHRPAFPNQPGGG